jgi:hypothetical protein
MSPTTTRWVFFIALLLLLPLPFYNGGLGWLPVVRVFFIVTAEGYLMLSQQSFGSPVDGILLLGLEVVGWVVLLWLAVSVYIDYTKAWPSTVRGSVMGLLVFSLLILLSSFPAYRPLGLAQGPITFLQVYH